MGLAVSTFKVPITSFLELSFLPESLSGKKKSDNFSHIKVNNFTA